MRIPKKIPSKSNGILEYDVASGIKSKEITDSIRPDASASKKLKRRFDKFLNETPIRPPIKVPIVPKNNPQKVELIKLKLFTSVNCINVLQDA